MFRIQRRALITLLFVLLGLLWGLAPQLKAQNAIDVRVDRWLRVQALTGEVQFYTADTSRAAQVGDLLTEVGDGVRTGSSSSCTLDVDTAVGTITLGENTNLVVRNLEFAPDDGRITHLYVSQGSVILNLRRFTNRGSKLEIETPSGVSGVRGTEFGIIVHPTDQRTGVATQTGEVFAAAQGRTVDVPTGYQTLIRLGEPPLAPVPIPEEPEFDYQVEEVIRNNLRYLVLEGQIDPINQVYVEGELQALTDVGEFQYESLAYHGASLQVRVVTPLGDVAIYDVSLL